MEAVQTLFCHLSLTPKPIAAPTGAPQRGQALGPKWGREIVKTTSRIQQFQKLSASCLEAVFIFHKISQCVTVLSQYKIYLNIYEYFIIQSISRIWYILHTFPWFQDCLQVSGWDQRWWRRGCVAALPHWAIVPEVVQDGPNMSKLSHTPIHTHTCPFVSSVSAGAPQDCLERYSTRLDKSP